MRSGGNDNAENDNVTMGTLRQAVVRDLCFLAATPFNDPTTTFRRFRRRVNAYAMISI